MILRPKCRKVSQIILTRPFYLEKNSLFFNIALARYGYLDGNAKLPNCSLPSRSLHGSIHSKRVDVPSKDWGRYLTTFEQYQYQSDLSQQSTQGPRLLDEPPFNVDFDLWLELILFQRRQQNIDNIRALYHEIITKDLCMPTTGATADELWNIFLYMGWETHTVWKDLVPYARRLQERTGRYWQPLYARILTRSLQSVPQTADLWHTRLRDSFKPSSADMKAIFRKAVSSEATLHIFRRMYLDFSFRDLYSTVIPKLCNGGNYKLALQWHYMMITKNDIPSDKEIAKPLSDLLAVHGTSDELISMISSMAKVGVPATASTNQSLPVKKATVGEIVNRQLEAAHGISSKNFSDEFCARLFATPAFPVDTLVRTMYMLGVDTLGPISLRELVSREFKSRKPSSPRPISQCLDKLREAGISIDNSTFSTVIINLAVQGDERLLQEVINCDMHPDAFEDQQLQETLLARYYARHEYQQVRRTLAILTAKCEPENLHSTLMNLKLRSALRRKDFRKAYQQLDMMQEEMVPLTIQSVSLIRRKLLSPRKVSQPPASTTELPRIVAIYKEFLRSGGNLRTSYWREILLRLGMTGLLRDVEKLSLWLAEWYSNPSFRASESSIVMQKSEQVPEYLSPANPRHPLRQIFSGTAQQAIVAWGFQHSGELYRNRKAVENSGFSWRWGIKLLRKLEQRNVLVLPSTIARACRLRFTALVGHGLSRRSINRTAHPTTIDQIMYMAQEIEKMWGSEIFSHLSHNLPTGDASRLEMLEQQIFGGRLHTYPIEAPKLRLKARRLIQMSHPLSHHAVRKTTCYANSSKPHQTSILISTTSSLS